MSAVAPLRVLLADDHRLFRQGLVSLMGIRPDLITVVGEAAGCMEALQLTSALQPDVVILDVLMPGCNGLQAARRLRLEQPQTKIVMLTASEENTHVLEALKLGVEGYLSKNLDAQELFHMFEDLRRGEVAITHTMATRILRRVIAGQDDAPLTERELEVLRLVVAGSSNPEVAQGLQISVNTVKVHMRNILEKLRVVNRTEAAAYAVRNGLVSRDHP